MIHVLKACREKSDKCIARINAPIARCEADIASSTSNIAVRRRRRFRPSAGNGRSRACADDSSCDGRNGPRNVPNIRAKIRRHAVEYNSTHRHIVKFVLRDSSSRGGVSTVKFNSAKARTRTLKDAVSIRINGVVEETASTSKHSLHITWCVNRIHASVRL